MSIVPLPEFPHRKFSYLEASDEKKAAEPIYTAALLNFLHFFKVS